MNGHKMPRFHLGYFISDESLAELIKGMCCLCLTGGTVFRAQAKVMCSINGLPMAMYRYKLR